MSEVDGLTTTIPRSANEIRQVVTDMDEVNAILHGLKLSSATGFDGVSSLSLKMTRRAIPPFLARLFNSCLSRGVMPGCWKQANVTPILKKGSASSTKKFRPISLLSCISKVLEKIEYKRVMRHVDENDSCHLASMDFVREAHHLSPSYSTSATALDAWLTSKLLFLDLSKAFDRVWWRALLHKLEVLGIRGQLFSTGLLTILQTTTNELYFEEFIPNG